MGRPTGGYRLADGTPVPGTTTILSRFKDSGALIKWAYKQGREHERLAMQGKPAPQSLHEIVDDAAKAGTIAHDMADAHIRGKPLPPFPPNAGKETVHKACNAFEQFLRWLDSTKTEIVETEMPLVHPTLKYGGTPDALGRQGHAHPRRRRLLDWKTSNDVYAEYLIQLGAYAILVEDVMGYEIEGYDILRFSKENADFSHRSFQNLDEAKRAFRLMREMYDIDLMLKRRLG